MTNREKFAAVYTQAFVDSYPHLPAADSADKINKVITTATENIRSVIIDGAAFRLTAKRLGIKHSYKSFEEFLKNES